MEATTGSEVRSGTLKLSSKIVGSTWTITLAGELDLANVEALQAILGKARAAGASTVIVDLEGLEFIDSSGIACLVYAHRDLDGDGGCLRVTPGQAPGVRRVMEATGLDKKLAFVADGAPC